VPLRSKFLAFLIENSSNKNSSQLADNKQKRPVLIENFEPNCVRVFAPRHAPQIAPAAAVQPQFAAFLPGLPAVLSEGLPSAFFAKGSVRSSTFLPGSRIARLAPQTMWLLALSLHLTNCRLNRLQLFRFTGVSNNRRLREIPARVGSSGTTLSEASFVVE
jgi:hypothetical protein